MEYTKHDEARATARLPAGRDAVHRQFVLALNPSAWIQRADIEKWLEETYKVTRLFDIAEIMAQVYDLPDSLGSSEPVVKALEAVKAEKGIRYVERNRPVRALARPDDPLFNDQWAWRRVDAEPAWKRAQGTNSVVVAVVDSGIATGHEDLAGEFWENAVEKAGGANGVDDDGNGVIDDINGARFTVDPPDGDVRDRDGHGTMLAGTIGAITDNTKGVAGAASPIKLMAVAFFDALTWPTSAAAARAILYAVQKNAAIINASWDVGFDTAVLRDAIQVAEQAGILVVAAAGNSGSDNDQAPVYPASYSFTNVISVMATDEDDERAWFSNYGEKSVHLAAPGVRILSTYPYFLGPPRPWYVAYRTSSGTSPAAAHVAGAAALLKHLNPQWTPLVIREHLMASVDGVSTLRRRCASGGRLNYRRAVVGPLQILAPGPGDVLPKNTIAKVVWRSDYATKACQTLSIEIRNAAGPWTVLASHVVNDGTANVVLPGQAMPKARIKIASERETSSTSPRSSRSHSRGASPPDPELLRAVVDADGAPARTGPPLSRVELDLLRLVADGLTNREIGQRLRWSQATVKKYVQRILEKLDVSDRTRAAVEGLRRGLLG